MTECLNGKDYTPKAKADLYRLYRRRQYKGGRGFKQDKDLYGAVINELITDFEQNVGDRGVARSMLLAHSGGDTKKIFLSWIVEATTSQQTTMLITAHFFLFFVCFARMFPC